MIILKTRSEVKVTVTKKWYSTFGHPKMHPHQIWNSYLKEYRSYAPDLMPIREIRSRVKVTVTGKLNGTIHHSKMLSHTKFGIPTYKNIRDMLQI